MRAWTALVVLLGSGCAPELPRETPRLLRLWQDNGPAFPVTVTARPPEAGAADAGAPQSTPPVQDPGSPDVAKPQWFGVVPSRDDPDLVHCEPLLPVDGELRLHRGALLAAVTDLRVRGGQGLQVRLTVAVPATNAAASLPLLAAVELRQPFDTAATISAKDVADLLDPRRHATHVLEATPSRLPRPFELTFVTDRLTQDVLLFLLAPTTEDAGLVATGLEVTACSAASIVAKGGEFPRMQRLGSPEGAVSVAFDRDERKGLLALPGRAYAFAVGRSTLERRLDLSLGVAPRDEGLEGALTVRIEADGRLLHEQRVTAPADPDTAAWDDLRVDLPPTPETSLVLTLSAKAEGEDPPLAVFGHPVVRTRGPASRPNVVLISLDTLRPDRLGCYGGDKTVSPRLDALAAAGLRFTQCSSTSSYTLPSHGSMLTGQYPAIHGAVDIDDRLDPGRSPFLARILADAGYVTAAFTGGGYVAPDYGFAEGFDRYSSNDPVWAVDSVRGQQLLQTVSSERLPAQLPLLRRYSAPMIRDWIAQQHDGVPFFAFLHTYVTHNYAPNHDWIVRRELLDELHRETPFNHKDREAFNRGEDVPRDKVVRQYMPYYEATIGMADEFVGGVLDSLQRAGLFDDTLVIVTSDHGEEFGEHGFFGHGETLFEAATRVPLIVHLPRSALAALAPIAALDGQPAPAGQAVVSGPVSLVDLPPWILDLVGLPPDPRMTLCSPDPADVSPPRRNLLFMELDTRLRRLSAVREGHLKLHTLFDGTTHGLAQDDDLLFDLVPDRGETRNVAPDQPADAARLKSRLKAFHDCVESGRPRRQRQDIDLNLLTAEQLEQLRQNGYIGEDGKPR